MILSILTVCTSASCHLHSHPWWAVERLFFASLFLRFVPFRVSLLHLALLFPLLPVLCPGCLLPCGQRQAKHFSPSSLTTSTTRRLLKSSSRRNPATKKRSPRTYVTWNLTMRPSVKIHLHHRSFRSEENQRTEDKLITFMKEVSCQLSHFSHTQERRDPCMNLVR